MSEATVQGGNSRMTFNDAPARAAGGIVLGALVTLVAIRRGFRAVTVKIGA